MRYAELLNEELYYSGHQLAQYFAGDCPIFAVALHKLTNFPIYALVEYDDTLGSEVLIHAYVRSPDGIIDATGDQSTVDDILAELPNSGDAYEKEFSISEILKIGYGDSPVPALSNVLPIAQSVLNEINEG